MKPTIVLSHANGFPLATYQPMIRRLEALGYGVTGIARFGHDKDLPPDNNWHNLVRELTRFIDEKTEGPIFLIGHSLGGFLSIMAALERADRVKGLILLDSPVLSGFKSLIVRAAKRTGLIRRLSPGAVSATRRDRWAHEYAAHAHFKAKRAFAAFDEECLAAYINHGTIRVGDERHLLFSRDIETAIYNGIADHLNGLLRRTPFPMPVCFIGGTRSTELRQAGIRATRRHVRNRIQWIEGSHLFPFESPAQTATVIGRVLAEFETEMKD